MQTGRVTVGPAIRATTWCDVQLRMRTRPGRQALHNEFRSPFRCCSRDFHNLVSALLIHLCNQSTGSLRFVEILFAFAVGLVDLTPRRCEKNWRRVAILVTRSSNEPVILQADQPSVPKSVRDATVEKGRVQT